MNVLENGHYHELEHQNALPEDGKMDVLGNGHCHELEHGNALPGNGDLDSTSQIEEAVRVLLHGLGEDVNREGIRKTPHRVAKALREGTRGYKLKVKDIIEGALFPEAGLNDKFDHAGGAGGLVIVRNLDLFSYCEACLLPFQVKCHVGYVPSGQRVVGLSKLSRVADVFAKRLQQPQRLADEVCLALHNAIQPAGVAVVLQCLHINLPSPKSMCLEPSLASGGWVEAFISSGSGAFKDKNDILWSDFLALLRFQGPPVDKFHDRLSSVDEHWCRSQAPPTTNLKMVNPDMVSAVTSILGSLGEDPSRKELAGTPTQFVHWLMKFKTANLNMKLNGFAHTKLESPKSNGRMKCGDNCTKQIHTALNLPFCSQCEHHLLPFHGVVHIGYLTDNDTDLSPPVGKPLLQSIVHFFGFKLQMQERFTRQIAEAVVPYLGGDVMVVAEASHTCMISRGIEKFGSSTATIAVLGTFATDPKARAQFLQGIPRTA